MILKNIYSDLNYCVRMQSCISFLAELHGFDITSEEDYLLLKLNDLFLPLSIEKIGRDIIAVKHYFVLNGDIAFDPMIEFLIVPGHSSEATEWTPISITQYAAPYIGLPEYRNCLSYNDNPTPKTLTVLDAKLHQDIANLAENWARNLVLQGWIKAYKAET
ncbi:hypothetical protein BGP_3477 [Beggiatoa sp. PS]|nr:hypothetical protein BGP_3477 [Beggiatoa sp. PS]